MPDVFLACEQSIMASGQLLSQAMADPDPAFFLERLAVNLEQAQAAVEVLRQRG